MNTDNGSLSFDIKLELDRLRKDVEKAKEQLRSIGRTAKDEGDNMDNALLKVGKTMGAVFAAGQVRAFISQVVSLRSEIQRLEISFETLAGKSKGNALFSEIRQFAVQTPMMMRDLAQGAQTMLAFNIEADKVMPMLKALGDISMGDAQRFNSLALAFSQMSATGRLMGQDLLQMINAGFNPLAQISEKTGKSIGTLKEEMEAGRISVEMVTQAFMDATAEGGKFHGMLESQAQGLAGAQAKLAGAIDDMMNEIGESMEGRVVKLYDTVTKLAQNYQQVGRVLSGLIATYGTYRAALIAVTAAKGWATAAEAVHYNWLLLVERAQKLLNATMLANPYVLVATLIAGVVAAMVSMKTETEKLREKEQEYEEQKQKAIEAEQKHREEIGKLCDVAGDEAVATDTRREALYQLEKKYPDIFAKYDTEISKLENIKKIKQEIAELDGKKSIENTANELADVDERIAQLKEEKQKQEAERDNGPRTWERRRRYNNRVDEIDRELKVLKAKRPALTEKKRKEDADAYFSNLTGIGDEELELKIKNRKNLIAKIDASEGNKTHGRIISEGTVLNGTYSRDELQAQLQMLERQKTSRASAKSPAEFAKEYKKAYDDAAKAYNDFLKKKDKLTPEEFAKKSKDLKDALDAAKKKYDSYAKTYEDKGAKKDLKDSNRKKVEAAERERAIEEAKQAEIKANRDAALEVRQEELNLQNDTTEKRLAQIELDKERMANAIADREQELLKRYRAVRQKEWENQNPNAKDEGKIFDYKSITLDTMHTDASGEGMNWLADALKAIEESKRIMAETTTKATNDVYTDEKKAWNEYLRDYGTFEQRRLAIKELAEQDMAKAQNKGEKARIAAKQHQDLKDIDIAEFKEANNWGKVFSDMGNVASRSLKSLKTQVQDFIRTQKNLKPDEIRELQEAMEQIDSVVNDRDPWGALGVTFINLRDANKDVKDAQIAYNKALKGGVQAEKEQAQATLNAAQTAKQKALNDATKAMQGAISQMQEYIGVATALTGMLESFGIEIPPELSGFLGGLSDALAGLESMDLTRPFSLITGLIKGIGGIGKAIGSLFNHDGSKEKRIAKLDEQIKDLDHAYDQLQKSMDKAYSADAAELLKKQNQLLEQKRAAIEAQIAEEESKKDSDNSRIAEWRKEIDNINAAIADNKEAMVDAIFGEDVKSAISNFADAYASMFDEGISKARASKNLVRDMIKKMIMEALKADLSAPMERVREMLNGYFADGVISDWEEKAVEGYVENVMQEQAAKWGWADKYLKDANGQDGGTRGGFTAMSQDSADELNGRFTAIQMDSAAMRVDVAASRNALENINTMLLPAGVNIAQTKQYVDEIRGMSLIAIDHLETISKNTHELFQMNERLGKIEKYTSRL